MITTFVCKAATLQEALEREHRLLDQRGGIHTDKCRIVAEQHLSQIEWAEFTANLLKDRDWLQRFSEEHSSESTAEVPVCIRVTGEGSQIALLIDTQGYDYARYVGFDRYMLHLDETMEVIAKLYSSMDETEIANWSMEAAQKLIDDQYRYEIENGYTPRQYDTADFYQVISEFIQQDTKL